MRQIRFTKEGYEALKKEYDELLTLRPAAVEDLQKSRELGDLSENGFYKAARAKLSSLDGRLRRLSFQLRQAVIVENATTGTVEIGSTVSVSDGARDITYHIVGDLEADPDKGKISALSPIGQALVGKKRGDQISIAIPSGTLAYTVRHIL